MTTNTTVLFHAELGSGLYVRDKTRPPAVNKLDNYFRIRGDGRASTFGESVYKHLSRHRVRARSNARASVFKLP